MPKPPSGWSSLIVLGLMMQSVAWLVQALDWTEGLGILTPIAILAVLTGAILGRQLWLPASLAHGWSTMIGLVATLVLGTFALAEYVNDPIELSQQPLVDQVGVVRDWFMEWLIVAVDGGAVPQTTARFVFVLWMAMLLWLVSYIAAWFLTRYVNWWGAVLPAGFAMLANVYNAPSSYLAYMAFFLLCAFVLAAQSHLALQQEEWQRRRIGYSPDIGLSLLRDGLMVAAAVIAIAWLAPEQPASHRLRDAVASARHRTSEFGDQFSRLFPELSYPARGGGTSFGIDMPLGGSISLGSHPVFDAAVEGLPNGARLRYFRLATYATYSGRGWQRRADTQIAGRGLNSSLATAAAATTPVTQTITTLVPGTEQLFAVPQPHSFSIPVTAEAAQGNERTDLVTIDSVVPLAIGDFYHVVSQVSIATEQELREAPRFDPAQITDRYLQLPADMPLRVQTVADQVTAGSSTRYDRARAIETHLRSYTYSETIADPPPEGDLVHWFLFEEQRGYCDYYSSAFVVMARSVGIPARLAAGYAAGDYVEDRDVYRQYDYHAHTWPEVYFPTFGWIEFEPTSTQDVISRTPLDSDRRNSRPNSERPEMEPDELLPDQQLLDLGSQAGAADELGVAGHLELPRPLGWLLAMALAALVPLASVRLWERRFRGLTEAQGAFARLAQAATWLGIRPDAGDTPSEYAEKVTRQVPESRQPITTITSAYMSERFGNRPSDASGATLRSAWRNLRRPLLLAATLRSLGWLRSKLAGGSETH